MEQDKEKIKLEKIRTFFKVVDDSIKANDQAIGEINPLLQKILRFIDSVDDPIIDVVENIINLKK